MLTRYVLPLVSAVAFSFAILSMTKAQQKPPSVSPPVDPGASPFGKQVAGAGIVEPETENIAVGTHVPGVVKAIHVRAGDRIKAGAPLFDLDDRQMTAELKARAAAHASAVAQLNKLGAIPRDVDVGPFKARLEEAKANVADKEKLYERSRRESASGVAAAEVVETREMAVKVARAQLERARAELAQAEARAWEFDLRISEAAVAQALAQRQQTETELARLKVLAPRVRKPDADRTRDPIPDGDLVEFKVLQVNVRPGEYVGASPSQAIIVLGTVGRLHVRVDVDENDIGRFREGMKGTATPRGEPGKRYPLTFVRVEPYVIPKKSLTGGNTERVDTRVLQVIYVIDQPDVRLYVGQQLDVSLDAAP